jgi:hypothetical protein
MRVYLQTLTRLADLTPQQIQQVVTYLKLFPHRQTIRAVMEVGTSPLLYKPALTAIAPVADIWLEPVDSYAMKTYRTEERYSARFRSSLITLKGLYTRVEIGNEANGDWLGHNVEKKVKAAWTVAKELGVEMLLTLYLDPTNPDQAFDWYSSANIGPVSFVGFSHYEREGLGAGPHGKDVYIQDWDQQYSRLGNLVGQFTDMGFSEFGGEADKDKPKATTADKAHLISKYNTMKVNHPRYVGAGGYWDATDDCALPPALNHADMIASMVAA